MIAALLLAAASPASLTAVDAERAFAARARQAGQWTAFREYAEPSAVMFDPQAVWAHEWLKGRKDPPSAIRWWPTQSFVSCDGNLAVNVGGWRNPAGGVGTFTTVWVRQKNGGWKWAVDGGEPLKRPLAQLRRPAVRKASCRNLRAVPSAYRAETKPTELIAGSPPSDAGQGRSSDGTLVWEWRVAKSGARSFEAQLWNGRSYRTVLRQQVPAPPAQPKRQ